MVKQWTFQWQRASTYGCYAYSMSGGTILKANVCCCEINVICYIRIIQHTAGQK